MVVKNYYKILDLETSHVSIDEIKSAYRQAAKKYHPDLNVGDNLAEERIKDINEAYTKLSNPTTKRKYDRIWNANNFRKNTFKPNGKETIVNMFFGKNSDKEREIKEKNPPIKGENVETEIKATLYEAFYGLEKKLSLRTIDGKMKTF